MNNFELYSPLIAHHCLVGSRGYGLQTDTSDYDYRGFYIAPTSLFLGLGAPPDQIEKKEVLAKEESTHWEIGKFIRLALGANPNIMDVVYAPERKFIGRGSAVESEYLDWAARSVLNNRAMFLSKKIDVTYGGYAVSQLKKFSASIATKEAPRWKNAMHLVRLLYVGINIAKTGDVMVDCSAYRTELMSIRNGEVKPEAIIARSEEMLVELKNATEASTLPDDSNYDGMNEILQDIRECFPKMLEGDFRRARRNK